MPLRKEKINELKQGEAGGRKIGNYRNPSYARKKNLMNPLAGYGQVDLFYTGAFAYSLFPVRTGGNKEFIFDASNTKKGKLIKAYGENILTISQERFDKVQYNEYADELAEFINKTLGL